MIATHTLEAVRFRVACLGGRRSVSGYLLAVHLLVRARPPKSGLTPGGHKRPGVVRGN